MIGLNDNVGLADELLESRAILPTPHTFKYLNMLDKQKKLKLVCLRAF